jgi:hypothetical protein
LGTTLNRENLRVRLILAFMYESDKLNNYVLKFIYHSKDGIFKSIIVSDEWIHFSSQNEQLTSKIMTEVLDTMNFNY